MSAEDRKRMSVKEFREAGYLQELNRLFLHPLGLALEVILEEDGSMQFGEVWDCREDGICFDEYDREKAERIDASPALAALLKDAGAQIVEIEDDPGWFRVMNPIPTGDYWILAVPEDTQ